MFIVIYMAIKRKSPTRQIYIAPESEELVAKAQKQAAKEGLSFSQYVLAGLRALLFEGKG